MADFASSVPSEPEKSGDYLHDRARIPALWALLSTDTLVRLSGPILGLLFSLGFTALAFQSRASWTVGRDWVVPALVPAFVLGGVAFGYLVERRRWRVRGPSLLLLVIVLWLTAMNAWRGQIVDHPDKLRDAMTIITTVALALLLATLVGSMAWVEARQPSKAATPEA